MAEESRPVDDVIGAMGEAKSNLLGATHPDGRVLAKVPGKVPGKAHAPAHAATRARSSRQRGRSRRIGKGPMGSWVAFTTVNLALWACVLTLALAALGIRAEIGGAVAPLVAP